MARVIAVAALALACNSAPPCGPLTQLDVGGCGKTFDIAYDPSTQTGWH